MSWKAIRRTYYLKRQFASSVRTKFKIVRLSYANTDLSRAEFPLSCWKIRAILRNRPDGTADVARRAAEKTGKADALIVIQSKPLPVGWTGKLWAMHQGIERARELNPAWLMFADADVLLVQRQ